MNYNIWLLNFTTGDFEFSNHSKFINRLGFPALAFNMAHKWCWNDFEKQREHKDGLCCYVEFV